MPQIAMGDLKDPRGTISFLLPPGSRFYPSEEQLLCYYLTSKNNGSSCYGIDVIPEMDLYNFDPFNFPETSCFRFGRGGRRRHWYFYVGRGFRERGRRRAGCGYWKRRGRVKDAVTDGAAKVVVGTRKSFEFYLGDSTRNAVRTHWVMYEYSLVDHQKASFVVCRVFFRSHHMNNFSEPILSSCAEESVATMRHVDVQNDGTVTSAVARSKIHDNNSRDDNNKVSKLPRRLNRELDDQIVNDPVLEQELIAILEEDFIELDDLLCPLPGIE